MAKTSKGQRTRERIYAAAAEIIAEQGFEGATMRAIAERAGLSAGAAYHYVRSKDELVLELYGQTQANLSEHAARVAEQGGNLRTRLEHMVLGGLDVLTPQRDLLGRLAAVVLVPGNPLSPFSARTHTIRAQAIENFQTVLDGEADAKIAELLWMMWMAVILLWLHDRTPEQRATRAMVRQTLPLFAQYLPMFGPMMLHFTGLIRDALMENPEE